MTLLRGRRLVPMVLAVLAALGAVSIGATTDDTPAPAAPLSVMSFNIRYGTAGDGANAWPKRRDLVIGVLRDHRPDVCGLQEALAFQRDELLGALDDYRSIGVGRDDGKEAGEFSAILYRTDRLSPQAHGTFWFSATPHTPGSASFGNRIPRICTWARFADREGGILYVYNVHLDHRSQPSRERSVELLLARIAGRDHTDAPVVVTGDFNAGERNPAMQRLLAPAGDEPSPLVDTFRQVHPAATAVGTFNGFAGRTDGEKIDYVLVSRDVEVVGAAIVHDHAEARWPSDHFPVKASIRTRGR